MAVERSIQLRDYQHEALAAVTAAEQRGVRSQLIVAATRRVTTTEAALATAPYIADWRNLVTAFSAFPDSLTALPKSATTAVARDDAVAYATLIGRGPAREPLYADYAIGTPYYATVAWSPIPAIRFPSRSCIARPRMIAITPEPASRPGTWTL